MNKRIKRTCTALFSALLAAPATVIVHADQADSSGLVTTTSTSTIDKNLRGSITLYKYKDNDGISADADGISLSDADDQSEAVKNKLNNDKVAPESGVIFKLLKVADIEQVTNKNVSGTYYTNLDQEFLDTLNDHLGNDEKLKSSASMAEAADKAAAQKHYESDELNEKLLDVNRAPGGEVALNTLVHDRNESDTTDAQYYCTSFEETGENGKTKLDHLPVGLYLITEQDKPDGDIASPSSPFLLSIPTTNIAVIKGSDNQTHQPGTVWQYDLTAYPKNGTIKIHKDILVNNVKNPALNDGNDTARPETNAENPALNDDKNTAQTETPCDINHDNKLTHQIDANIGDIVPMLTSVDVPRLVDDLDDEQDSDDINNAETDGKLKAGRGTNNPDGVPNSDNKRRKHNAEFKVTDNVTNGLKIVDHAHFEVKLGQGTWENATTPLIEGEDYTIELASDRQFYVLTMTSDGLKKLDNIPAESYLYIKYDTVLTKDAAIGTEASTNQSSAELKYATNRTEEHIYKSNIVKVFTYEIDLTKEFTNGTQGNVSRNDTSTNGIKKEFDYSKVKFTIRGSVKNGSRDAALAQQQDEKDETVNHALGEDATVPVMDLGKNGQPQTGAKSELNDTYWEQMLFVKTGDGTYRVWDPLTDNSASYDSATDTVKPDTSYSPNNNDDNKKKNNALSDVADAAFSDNADGTVSKYVIPNSKNGLLQIRGLDSRTYEFTEVSTAPGRNLMADSFYVELDDAPKDENDTDQPKLENGQLKHAYVWTGQRPNINTLLHDYDIRKYSADLLDSGRVPVTVQNNEVIKVLKTGGKGVWIYAGVGIGIIALGAFLLHKKDDHISVTDTNNQK